MTDSTQLQTIKDLLGEHQVADQAIIDAVQQSEITVCGWGSHPMAAARAKQIFELLDNQELAHKLHVLQINKNGSPKHPLYVPYSKLPVRLFNE